MDNEYTFMEVKLSTDPSYVTLNLDKYPLGYGLKYFEIIYKGKNLRFTPDEIFEIFIKLKDWFDKYESQSVENG